MNNCSSGWRNAEQGHMCVWNGKGHTGAWFNYGPFNGRAMRARITTWILGAPI